jgi:hypothetical protein
MADTLFPLDAKDRQRLQERLLANVQRRYELQNELLKQTTRIREEMKKIDATIRTIVDELEKKG